MGMINQLITGGHHLVQISCFSGEVASFAAENPFRSPPICPASVQTSLPRTWRTPGKPQESTHSSPWKIPPFLSSVNHLFRLGPSKNHGYVTNNQRVDEIATTIRLKKTSDHRRGMILQVPSNVSNVAGKLPAWPDFSTWQNLHGFHGDLQKNYVETKPKEHI